MPFIPTTMAEMRTLGLDQLDFVIVSGDAYVDQPSFGVALVGRYLEALGWSVGIIARPDPSDTACFRALGRPRLAFLVTGGAIDSMVCKYTANRKPRLSDDYAPGGNPQLCRAADGSLHVFNLNGKATNARPDHAVIAYCAKCREAYKGVPIVVGGLEASLRRMSHYDYLSDTVRKPIILDAKADLVVYGMAELALATMAARLEALLTPDADSFATHAQQRPSGSTAGDSGTGRGTELYGELHGIDWRQILRGIPGTVWRTSRQSDVPHDAVQLPAHSLTSVERHAFAESFALQYRNTDPASAKPLVEAAAGQFVVQEVPARHLSRDELDQLYTLPFERAWHPVYETHGGVPALAEVKFSITSSRGCFGACAFCSLAFHQGRIVSARSRASLTAEAVLLTSLPGFKGYIHDVGGPTANFRNPACDKQALGSSCVDRRCLVPDPCPALKVDHRDYLAVLRAIRAVPGVKKVFVRSGIRFDYVMADLDGTFLDELAAHHVSGQLKVAPEHVSDRVLQLMGKPPHHCYEAFARRWAATNHRLGLKQFLLPYFIASHPGATLDDAIMLAEYLRDTGFVPDQVQDFYPTPGTLATAMYHTCTDPLTGAMVHVAKDAGERAMQRALLQFNRPENRDLVLRALRATGRTDLIGSGPHCLVR
jgi:uncharacterized radical SAM protein YgiQ